MKKIRRGYNLYCVDRERKRVENPLLCDGNYVVGDNRRDLIITYFSMSSDSS